MGKVCLSTIITHGALVVVMTTGLEGDVPRHPLAPADAIERVVVDGRERSYWVHIPPQGRLGRSPRLPLIVAFHGSSASASVIERETGFDQRADSVGFVVVYPEGLHRGWNIGECCRYSFKQHVNETAFVDAILDQLHVRGLIDTTRVYLTGYSDGATLSYLVACQRPRRITAIAGVSGTLFEPMPRCDLPRPVSAMVVHGTGDTRIPYGGRRGGPPESDRPSFMHSAPDVAEFWRQRNRCDAPGDTARHGNVIRVHYACAGGSEVVFYTILRGQHGWPGGGRGWIFSPRPPVDMSATDTMVRFFLRHQLGRS